LKIEEEKKKPRAEWGMMHLISLNNRSTALISALTAHKHIIDVKLF
jgi:hypothetical protein